MIKATFQWLTGKISGLLHHPWVPSFSLFPGVSQAGAPTPYSLQVFPYLGQLLFPLGWAVGEASHDGSSMDCWGSALNVVLWICHSLHCWENLFTFFIILVPTCFLCCVSAHSPRHIHRRAESSAPVIPAKCPSLVSSYVPSIILVPSKSAGLQE